MSRIIVAVLVLFFLSTGMELEISGPEQVEVASSTGKFNAEILSVRDTTLVLVLPSGADQRDLINEKAQIIVVRNDDIFSIKTNGSSYLLVGAISGCLGGCVTGYLVAPDEKKGRELYLVSPSDNYAMGFGCVGAPLGAIIGDAASTKDSLWVTPAHRDFKALRALARYPDMEPDFIRRVGK